MSFSSDLKRMTNGRKKTMLIIAKATFIELGNRFIQGSPVRTGMFVNSWSSAIGSVNYSTADTPDPSRNEAKGRLTETVDAMSIGQIFYFTNASPQSQRIEYDAWSAQSTAGVVRVNVAQLKNILADKIREHR